MTTIALYVSGHGYGHAVRSTEVARELTRRGAAVVLLSSAEAEAFEPLPEGARLLPCDIDFGVIQRSSLEVDEAATLEGFDHFSRTWPERVPREAERLRALDARVVVADIAPLGLLAARRAGLPALLMANFTWDWIYSAWADRHPQALELAARCREAQAAALLLLELPLSGGLEGFARRERLPLVVRHARRERGELRRALGLGEDQIGVFVAFGGFGPPALGRPVDVDPDRFRFFGYTPLDWPEALYRVVDRRRFEHPDLVAALDVVLGKPGYGTVAECSIHDTRMLWLGRARFPEAEVLARAIRWHVGGSELDLAAARAGRLGAALEAALLAPPEKGPLPGDGAERAAERILQIAAGAAA